MQLLPRLRGALLAAAIPATLPSLADGAPATTWNELALRRAVGRLSERDYAGAADILAAQDSGAVDVRADFLEAWSAREIGEEERFGRAVERVLARGGDVSAWADAMRRLEHARSSAIPATGASPADALATAFGVKPKDAVRDVRAPREGPRQARIADASAGFAALREGRTDEAWTALSRAETSWREDAAALAGLSDPDDAAVAQVFRAWHEGGSDERAIRLDVTATNESLARHFATALDLRRPLDGDVADPQFAPVPADGGPASLVAPPAAAELEAARRIEHDLRAACFAQATARRALDLSRTGSRRDALYFGRGLQRAEAERRSADAALADARVLLARSAEIVAKLRALRDEEIRRIASRSAAAREEARKQELVTRALLRFRAEGPSSRRAHPLPAGVPTPAELLREELTFSQAFDAWVAAFATQAPILVTRSHDEIWVPRATAGLAALVAAAEAEAARATRAAGAIAAARDAALDPARHAPLAEAVGAADRRVVSLADSLRHEQRRVVSDAVAAAQREHSHRGEGILYGASVAAHERAVASGDAADSASLSRALLHDAESRHRAFLAAYPESRARSEVRFRLADALLHSAREDFRVAMTRFLGDARAATEADARSLAPFVDYAPALAIHDSLLVDDPAFVHRDAVLFQAGMIRSDQGDDTGLRHLEALVRDWPASTHAQEAHLRLGDRRFDAKDWTASLVHYDAAASGHDVEHAAVAMYQAGWARSNLEDSEGAAVSFLRLLDHYDAHPEAARTTDLRDEAEDHLVQCLARAGGASSYDRLFPASPEHARSARVLAQLADLYREYSRFPEAVAADSTWLARWPESPQALATAQSLAATLERAERKDAARDARLALAPRFREGAKWWNANDVDSLRAAGDAFARAAYGDAALHHHRAARESGEAAEWRAAAAQYATLTDGWPNHGSAPAWRYGAGEAASALLRYEDAIREFQAAAASDTASFRVDAQWQAIAARDAWYESGRPAATPGAKGPEKLARPLVDAIGIFVGQHPADKRTADLLWRQGHVSRAHGWTDEAIGSFATFASTQPADPRALDASRLAAQLLVERENFVGAGDQYAAAARIARSAGQDSIATEMEAAVPACATRHAEQIASRSGEGKESARLFEDVAARWPQSAQAPAALYRAGAGWRAAGETSDAVRVWTQLSDRYPKEDLARDAMLETARAWKDADRPREASRAWERFATRYPDDADAGAALLEAADLAAAAGDSADGERIEDVYMERHPEDVVSSLAFLERRARREVAAVSTARPISTLLAAPARPAALARWMDLAKAHPDSAAADLAAQVAFLRGEEARAKYETARLTLPLGPSVAQKKSLLESAIQEYRNSANFETAPWNRASATRIGECLVAFGDALMTSERPADLGGDDLLAYDQEIERRSWEFFDRGEEVWTDLVRRAGDRSDDEWVETARRALYPRIARRFAHRPEVDFPLAALPTPEETTQP